MIRLSRLFENHLDDPGISAEEARNFAEDLLAKTRAQAVDPDHGPAYLALADGGQPVLAAFDTALGQRATLLASLEGGTITKDDAVRLLRTTVRQREGRVRDSLGVPSAGYQEFFPHGLQEYTRARLGQVPALLDQFIAAATRHQAKTGAPLLTEFQTLKTTFATAREGQVADKGEVTAARQAVASARAALDATIGPMLLEIARLNWGHPERAATFLDQSLLEDPTRSRRDDGGPGAPAGTTGNG